MKTEIVLDFPDLNSALLLGFYIGGTSCLFFKREVKTDEYHIFTWAVVLR